jgi:hypothetical protein
MAGPGHGDDSAGMLQSILKPVPAEFAFDPVAGPSDADAFRVSSLNHKAGYHPVENQVVVKTSIDERDEIIYGIGSDIGIQFNPDIALSRNFQCNNRFFIVWHVKFLRFPFFFSIITPVEKFKQTGVRLPLYKRKGNFKPDQESFCLSMHFCGIL